MLVLMREDLARELGAPILAEVARLRPVGRRLPPDRAAPGGRGRGAGDPAPRWPAAGVDPDEVGYVNSHGTGTAKNDPAETAATKVGLGEHAVQDARSQQHEVDDRPPARRRRRGREHRHRARRSRTRSRRRPPTTPSPTPSATSTTCPNEARALAIDVARLEQLRVRRRERVRRLGARRRARLGAAPGRLRPRRDHRAWPR